MIKMRAKLANVNHCTVPFLRRAAVLALYYMIDLQFSPLFYVFSLHLLYIFRVYAVVLVSPICYRSIIFPNIIRLIKMSDLTLSSV